ncbi:MAG TPA: hypothetical protein PLP26_15280 [Ilumatobacteraceae bacterium]|nr:hypothetical protein [Ilumatobacteraceae bacterium]
MNRRTSFITAAAVAGVVLTGTTAMAANIGMLNSGDGQNAGDSSSASAVVTTPVDAIPVAVDPQVIDVYIEDPAIETTAPMVLETTPEELSQVFAVEAAGTVTVEPTATGVLLDGVTVAEGWGWTANQPSPTELEVTFTAADVTYLFSASLGADGLITARVDQPIVQIVQAPALAAVARSSQSSPSAPTAQASSPVAAAPTGAYYEDDDDHYEDDDLEGGEHDD